MQNNQLVINKIYSSVEGTKKNVCGSCTNGVCVQSNRGTKPNDAGIQTSQ